MTMFAALFVWAIRAKMVVFRVVAVCLAFIPAMTFGIATVNKYYAYYQTWGALANDLSGQGSIPKVSVAGAGSLTQLEKDIKRTEGAEAGYLFRTTVSGSHLTRDVYVYLPRQYFQKPYAHLGVVRRIPAIVATLATDGWDRIGFSG